LEKGVEGWLEMYEGSWKKVKKGGRMRKVWGKDEVGSRGGEGVGD